MSPHTSSATSPPLTPSEPGATEGDVLRLLGQKSINTTLRYINALETAERSPVDQFTDRFTR